MAGDVAGVFKELSMAATPDKLTAAERDVICEALEVYAKTFDRAATAAKVKPIATANEQAAASVRMLFNKVKSTTLEL